jgi:hypothetical protein
MLVSRTAALVLIDLTGELLGALAPFEVDSSWWQEAGDVVPVVQERYGLEVDVLRLLATERAEPHEPAIWRLETARRLLAQAAPGLAPVRAGRPAMAR